VGQHARGGAERGPGRAEAEVSAGEGIPVEGQEEEAAALEPRVDQRWEARVGGVVVRREEIARSMVEIIPRKKRTRNLCNGWQRW
jgi:hypothetical protein